MDISPEYIAQQFRDCLTSRGLYSPSSSDVKKGPKRNYSGGWHAEQHGNKVNFKMRDSEYEVAFENSQDSIVAHCLELIVEPGSSSKKEIPVGDFHHRLKITKKGKISPPSMIRFFESNLIVGIRKYLDPKQQ